MKAPLERDVQRTAAVRITMRRKAVARFWFHVRKSESCWHWCGPVYGNNGYGRFMYDNRIIPAHRFSWLLHKGCAADLDVLHSCDNPLCVNPAHLSTGTHADNMRDRNRKGRQAKGEQNGRAKVDAATVLLIRYRLARGESAVNISRDVGLDASSVIRIGQRKTWAHLPEATDESSH